MRSSSDESTHLKENSTTDVSVGFQRPYLCSSKGHQHGGSLQSFINLGITLFRISRFWNIERPDSWRDFLHISSHLFFIFQMLDILYWLVCIFFTIDGVTVNSETQQCIWLPIASNGSSYSLVLIDWQRWSKNGAHESSSCQHAD